MPTTTPFANLITFSRGSNATVVGPNGLVQWAPSNLLTFSEQFDNAAWVKSSATVAANSLAAPDGSATADTLTASGANGTALQTFTALATPYTFSIWLRRLTGTGDVQLTVDGTTFVTVAVTLTWTRFSTTLTPSAGSRTAGVRIVTSGDAVYAWGAQLELGTAATTYNSTTVKNLLGFSEAFDNAAWIKTAVSMVTGAQANPINGLFNAQKLMETTANNSHVVQQAVTVANGVTHVASVYAKAGERSWLTIGTVGFGTGYTYFNLTNGTIGTVLAGHTASITAIGNGWYRCSIAATSTTTSAVIYYGTTSTNGVSNYTGDGNSGVYIYGAQLSDSASLDPYVPTPGAAPSSTAYYGPRFDYDPVTLQPRGILIEEQRTNLLTGSADFTATYWPTATNITVAADNAASPDGTTNADKLTDNTTAGVQHRLYRDYTFTSAAAHTLSVFAKRNDHRWFRLFFYDGTTSFFANFDLLNGVVGSKQASTISTITSYGNGWYRITMTATVAAAAGNVQMVMLASDDTGVPSLYTGTGTSLWLYGAQLEAGAFATSYIPTIASTVTRSADVATITGQNFAQWYAQPQGTFVAEATLAATGGTSKVVVSADFGVTNNESLRLSFVAANTSAEGLVRAGSTTVAAITAGSFTAGTVVKMAVAATLNSANAAANGATGVEDTSLTMPTPNLLNLGYSTQSATYLNGHIRSIRYIPVRAADFQLQALTT